MIFSYYLTATFIVWNVCLSASGRTSVRPAPTRSVPTRSTAQASARVLAGPLVFDGVTVIDVVNGHRLAGQRVVIMGNRIRAMGSAATVKIPAGARVVDARGKFLIPGLWDMHMHPDDVIDIFYPMLIANGVTGYRNGWSPVPLSQQRQWRRAILAGTLVGPPRQLLAGPAFNDSTACAQTGEETGPGNICLATAAEAASAVDSIKADGADFIKTYTLGTKLYYAVAAEARRIGIPFGGHIDPHAAAEVSAMAAADSGAWIIDHTNTAGGIDSLCLEQTATQASCQQVADHLRHHGTWWVPTLSFNVVTYQFIAEQYGKHSGALLPGMPKFQPTTDAVSARMFKHQEAFWNGVPFPPGWLRGDAPIQSDTLGFLRLAHRTGLPILAGTDDGINGNRDTRFLLLPGYSLQAEVADYVTEGLTPLEALQTATLNPAKALHATDSLGTVAPGKVADLVLLDGDPLADIGNLSTIRAVVANGRYFDRTTLDQMIAAVQVQTNQMQKN